MTFIDTLNSLDIQTQVSHTLLSTKDKVQTLLRQKTYKIDDLPALLSIAAESELEPLAQKANKLTVQRFGKTMQLFVPMYLSNECYNTCTYCGFSYENKYPRKTLTDEEILKEGLILKEKGFQHLLILTGESPKVVGTDYIVNAIKILKPLFSSISIEVQPLSEHDYKRVIEAGADGLTIYQETYHRESYKKYHTFGKKKLFDQRLEAAERGARAGFYRINIGALLGLHDWRYEAIALANHLHYLTKHHWQCKFAVSFPRITDVIGGFKPSHIISDKALVQLIIAFRLIFPDIIITLSTREPQELRDQLIPMGITQMSAESDTAPGGYSDSGAEEQFDVSDHRSLKEIQDTLLKKGYEPVMKDWESVITSEHS
ncbi:2-iminoacetate synthase ThiH [Candidatus Marinamargulisbacteria bacterium SCGC AAA071-K20]|nr:2-iminoacetate synthase ThiH [Candidatus Marinamargulisbacteria bacterium SCGC AAA071-K20]